MERTTKRNNDPKNKQSNETQKQNKPTKQERRQTKRINTHITQHPPHQEPRQLTEDEQEGTKEVEPHWLRFVEDPEYDVCHDEEVDEGGSANRETYRVSNSPPSNS